MIIHPRDKFSGESGLQVELMKAQTRFYKWGTWALGIMVVTFFLYLTFLILMIVVMILGYAFIDGIINGLGNNMPRY